MIRQRQQHQRSCVVVIQLWCMALVSMTIVMMMMMTTTMTMTMITTVTAASETSSTTKPTTTIMTIYATMPVADHTDHDAIRAVARKQKYDLEERIVPKNNGNSIMEFHIHYMTMKEQRAYLQLHNSECGGTVDTLSVFDALQQQHDLQTELFKWCALATTTTASTDDDDDDDSSRYVVSYIDSSSPIIDIPALTHLMTDDTIRSKNIVVMDDATRTVHGSYMQFPNTKDHRMWALNVLQTIVKWQLTEPEVLPSRTVLIPRMIYESITTTMEKPNQQSKWYPLHLSCRTTPSGGVATTQPHDHFTCTTGYCCSIQDTKTAQPTTLLFSRHFFVPTQIIPPSDHPVLPKPLYHTGSSTTTTNHKNKKTSGTTAQDAGTTDINDIPFISTVTVKELSVPDTTQTPMNFYELLEADNCLPSTDHCTKCLREKKGATCESDSCRVHCSCYCSKLCTTPIPPKPMVQEWTITPPIYKKHPHRYVPRIVHQTWFESIDDKPEQYPNMSRLVESFKRSGWEYRFYTDDDVLTFLQLHFPPEVLQAYDALIPGAFKADLFRYCVLLIHGGLYADVDIQLQSALDLSIPDDVGFMVPMDEPGKPANTQMCVWNGLIASAPSHPFLAKAIETIVNQVRNRYTSVDIDATFCPNPELSVLHAYDTLFTAGPCMLGASINRVLGRNPQSSHVPGEIHTLWTGPQRQLSMDGTSFVQMNDNSSNNDSGLEHRIPGRTIILQQNKWDMGAHRFTFVEQNIVVAATDLPDSNDRAMNIAMDNENNNEEEGMKQQQQHEHYSKAHAKTGVYGVEHLYNDRNIVHEDIRIVIDATLFTKQQLALSTTTTTTAALK